MTLEVLASAYVLLIVALALFVGWELERSRKRRYPGRYSSFYRDND